MEKNIGKKIESYRMSVRKINPWIRFLLIALVMAVAGVSTWAVSAYLVKPLTGRSTLTLSSQTAVPADAKGNVDLAKHYEKQITAAENAYTVDLVAPLLKGEGCLEAIGALVGADEQQMIAWAADPDAAVNAYLNAYPDAGTAEGVRKHIAALSELSTSSGDHMGGIADAIAQLQNVGAKSTMKMSELKELAKQCGVTLSYAELLTDDMLIDAELKSAANKKLNLKRADASVVETMTALKAALESGEPMTFGQLREGLEACSVEVSSISLPGNSKAATELLVTAFRTKLETQTSVAQARQAGADVLVTALAGVPDRLVDINIVNGGEGELYVNVIRDDLEEAKAISAKVAAELDEAIAGPDASLKGVIETAQAANAMKQTVLPTLLAVLIAGVIAYIIFSGMPLFDVFNTIFFALFTLLCVFPFYYLFINTISDNDKVTGGMVNFYPIGFHLNNYISLKDVSDLGSSVLVTVARTIIGTALMVIVSAWAGYLVTKQKMWKRSFMYRALVITMYFNAGLIPWYMNMLMLGLTDNVLAYIIPGMIAPYNIILVKTYIESIPASLEESAVIDGANTPTVFLKIILPLSVPILATIAIFGAVGNWNSFQDSLLLMSGKPELYTLQHRLYVYLNKSSNLSALVSGSGQLSQAQQDTLLSSRVIKYTISMVSIIPILCVYPFMQRFFVKGIMLGAVKG